MNILLAYIAPFIKRSGGMEKICCELANYLEERGNNVFIIYYSKYDGKPFYSLHQNVQMLNLMDRIKNKNWEECKSYMPLSAKVIRELLRILSKRSKNNWNEKWKTKYFKEPIFEILQEILPDVVISFDLKTSNILLSTSGFDAQSLITMFHFDPMTVLKDASTNEINSITKSAIVQVLVPSYEKVIKSSFPKSNVIFIPNPVPQYKELANLSSGKKFYKIINVARLYKKQKQQHLLIQAFSKLSRDYPNWNLEFWGEEQNRDKYRYTDELQNYISKYHLENRVFLKGTTKNILQVYLQADIFCLPSAYEGFCLALTEAMSAGLPVVAFKSCPSIEDIVIDEKTGLLADNDIDSLADKLRVLMNDARMRVQIGHNAHIEMEKFESNRIWEKWDHIIQTIYNRRDKSIC